jgi:hypothetical protein
MKNFLILFFLLGTSSCTMFEKQEGSQEMQSVIQEIIKEKDVSGIKIEITKIPPIH